MPGLSDSSVLTHPFHDQDISDIFSDAAFVQKMLDVEVALALVEAEAGIIPADAAGQIEDRAGSFSADIADLRSGMDKAGIPVIAFLKRLREHVGGEAASYIHWGATSQDIIDTALVLQIAAALALLDDRLGQTIDRLARLARAHRSTPIAGRTHSQQAVPIAFGYKVAGWIAPLLRHRQRLTEMKPRLLVVQFGGAAGTLAPLGDQGIAVQAALAERLGLGVPDMPWHTQRDNLAELAGWLSLVSGSLAKMAQDVILLAQTEVAEIRETDDPTRGGSSTMPQKANPILSEVVIAAARSNAALLSSMHHALIQEHERATHAWQLEWLTLPQMFGLTAAAFNQTLLVAEKIVVYPDRMRANLESSNGLLLAEAFSFALAPHMGREAAKTFVRDCCRIAAAEDRHLVDVLTEKSEIALDWDSLRRMDSHLGSAEAFIDRILAQV